jgi:transposase-like protein
VNEDELKNLHQTLPLRCPYCTATEEFEATELREAGTKFDYQYTCDLCEYSFGSNMQPDRIRRMLSHPALKFTIREDSESGAKDEPDRDDDQHQINDFD